LIFGNAPHRDSWTENVGMMWAEPAIPSSLRLRASPGSLRRLPRVFGPSVDKGSRRRGNRRNGAGTFAAFEKRLCRGRDDDFQWTGPDGPGADRPLGLDERECNPHNECHGGDFDCLSEVTATSNGHLEALGEAQLSYGQGNSLLLFLAALSCIAGAAEPGGGPVGSRVSRCDGPTAKVTRLAFAPHHPNRPLRERGWHRSGVGRGQRQGHSRPHKSSMPRTLRRLFAPGRPHRLERSEGQKTVRWAGSTS
jgi:hypothetical protein